LGGVTYLGDNSKSRAELGLEHRSLREGTRRDGKIRVRAAFGVIRW
jgi:hypothetical protein